MPECDLNKRVPHGKKVLGIYVVVWWDKKQNAWKVFDDMCPHRLAPLSEGRIDANGRLQCVYHGWCFDGSGRCKLIPQAPVDGPPVLEFSVKEIRVDGFDANVEYGSSQFAAPCLFCFHADMPAAGPTKKSIGLIFLCIPVSPGNSRLIWAFPRNFDLWVDKVVPRWMLHLGINLVFDSDLHLLHVEEKKIKEIGMKNWQKACFVATKSDAIVIGFRKWYNEYSEGEVDWRGKYSGVLPPTPPREQLMDSSCNGAYKNLKALETTLMVLSVGMIAIVAATKEGMMLATSRTRLAIIATICFIASRWLARFVYTKFRYHDYNHALLKPTPFLALIQRIGLAM
ncbi:Protochlorophyllide-dependent translocon component 52, chloroplastic [Linum perenne]